MKLNIWVVMVAGGLLTYLTRLSFIYLLGRIDAPEWLMRALKYVPPAVLSAIILPEIVMPTGVIDLSLTNLRLFAGLIAILVAWFSRSALLTIVLGMLALWGLQALF